MEVLSAAQARQRQSIEQAPATVSNLVRGNVGSVPTNVNAGNI